MTDSLQNQSIPLSVQKALDVTEFKSFPPNAPNYKFVFSTDGSGVFWVPPFEVAGGKFWGEVWDEYKDHPHHGDVLEYLEWTDDNFAGAGYGLDGEVQVQSEFPVTKFTNQIFEWWPDYEYIEWDGKDVSLSSLEWFKSANKKQKQRKRRNKAKQRGVLYYGPWWAGVTSPNAVISPGETHDGGGTTENSTGGDFGG